MRIVSIIGKAQGYEKVYDVKEGIVWTVPSVYHLLTCQVNMVFELHQKNLWPPWLATISDKLMMANPVKEIKCRKFPSAELIEIFGNKFSGSIPWMIAYAIWMGYQKINIFGVHMNAQGEYGKQRDSTFYMIGQAEGRGIKVYVPPDSGLYLNELYGRENEIIQ